MDEVRVLLPPYHLVSRQATHNRQLAEHGGRAGIRDANLLDSALARPQPLHTYGDPAAPDLADLAASLALGLARHHPFLDGNKRTAHVCYRVFLSLNGAELIASDKDKYLNMLALAEGSMAEAEFAAWLREHLQMDTTGAVNEPAAEYAGG